MKKAASQIQLRDQQISTFSSSVLWMWCWAVVPLCVQLGEGLILWSSASRMAVGDSWVSKPEPEMGQVLRLHCCSLGVLSDYCFRSLPSPANQNWFMYSLCVRVCLLYTCMQLCGTCTIACTVWVCMMISWLLELTLAMCFKCYL